MARPKKADLTASSIDNSTSSAKSTTTSSTKKTSKTPAKKTCAKKDTPQVKPMPTEKVFIQYAGNEYVLEQLVERTKKAWETTHSTETPIESINLYVKPEEQMAYYVINGNESGKISL